MTFQPRDFQLLSKISDGTPVTVCYGDGIGPEIMRASLNVLQAAGARLRIEPIEVGQKIYDAGISSGIPPEAWDSIRRTGVFYKAPIATPQGGGLKSLNVTIRKSLGLYANVRPNVAYWPLVETKHPGMDVTIIRENEEDLYAGIEHRQTGEVYQCLKLVSRPGTEKIIRYAFEYARVHGRKRIACFTKDNIMKLTDGLFHRVFDEIGAEYPEIDKQHMIVDIGMAKLAATPTSFDVIVVPNLYGDIASDVAAEVAGSVGMGASCNIGEHGAMFEAIHGSAPDIAGLGIANPSGLLLAGVQMLVHIGQVEAATLVHNAWLKTIEDGLHTADIYDPIRSSEKIGTFAFSEAVIARLGRQPSALSSATYALKMELPSYSRKARRETKHLVGVDVFVDWDGAAPDEVADKMTAAVSEALGGLVELTMITNRGTKVWPNGLPETFCTDHWRVRYMARPGKAMNHSIIAEILRRLTQAGIDFVKTEGLFTFDGKPGYTLGQGQ